jgi:hypothetical protein
MSLKFRSARTACAVLTLVASGLGVSLSAASADAATSSQPSWCGWHPANTMWNPGDVLQAPLNLRTGQSTLCNSIGTFKSTGWGQVNIHCYTTNGSGETWYYVDSTLGNGWVFAGDILGTFDAQGC